MSSSIVEIVHPRGRALKQSILYAVVLLAGLGLVWLAVSLFSGGAGGVIIGILVGVLGVVALLVSGAVLWSFLPAALGRADPALVADDQGIHWQGVDFPWSAISGLTVQTDRSISFAGGADAALDRAAERAMAAAGVGDGSRSLVVHLRDAAAARAAAGRADYLIKDGSAPGSGAATLVLDGVTDSTTFADAATRLIHEAERRGIPTDVRVG